MGKKTPVVADVNARLRFDRVRLLNEELDRLGVDSAARNASVSGKASFLAVAAGVVLTAATSQLWAGAALLGLSSVVLSCAGLLSAAIALRPGRRLEIQARRLVDRHLDCTHSAAQVEEEIVSDKATVLAAREDDLRGRATWVWVGFGSLVAAAVALAVVFGVEVLGGSHG